MSVTTFVEKSNINAVLHPDKSWGHKFLTGIL